MAAQTNSAFHLDILSGAPAREFKPEAPRIVENEPKTKGELISEVRVCLLASVATFLAAAVFLLLFRFIAASNVELMEQQQKAQALQATLATYQSENVRLNVELNAFTSNEAIDDYAVNVLGMKKLERYRIHYFGNQNKDRAVVVNDADGKN